MRQQRKLTLSAQQTYLQRAAKVCIPPILSKNSLDFLKGPDQQNNVPLKCHSEITFASESMAGTAFQVSEAIFAWWSFSTE
jgi:hypothetical protein